MLPVVEDLRGDDWGGGEEGECCVLGLSLQVAMLNWTGLKNEEPYYLRSQEVQGVGGFQGWWSRT